MSLTCAPGRQQSCLERLPGQQMGASVPPGMESPVTKTVLGKGAQQLLPGRFSPSPAEVIPHLGTEPEPWSRVHHKNMLFWGACKIALHAVWFPGQSTSFSVR